MTARTLVLLRHGRTAWNADGRAQGHADVSLDDVGRAQAAAVAPYVAAMRPVRLWSSDLARARETADVLARTTAADVELDKRLREYDVGARQGLTMPEFAEQFPDEHAAWLASREDAVVDGAETTSDVLARIVPALQECLGALAAGETGIVVGHGASLRVGLTVLLGWPPALAMTLRGLDNCGWAVLEQHHPDHPPRLASYNRRA